MNPVEEELREARFRAVVAGAPALTTEQTDTIRRVLMPPLLAFQALPLPTRSRHEPQVGRAA